mgnify:CR=1 FL=1
MGGVSPRMSGRHKTIRSILSGKTIMESGLLKLNYSLLSEIKTAGKIISSIRSNRTLKDNDVLVFIGQPEAVTELRQIPGLSTIDDQLSKMEAPKNSRALVEAILATNSAMVGKTVKRSLFRYCKYGKNTQYEQLK